MRVLVLSCVILLLYILNTCSGCQLRTETYYVKVATSCTGSLCLFTTKRRTRQKLVGCSGCGGCGGTTAPSQPLCTVSRWCSGWGWWWCHPIKLKACCEGYTLVDRNTCAQCGVNKFGPTGTYIVGGNQATHGKFPWQVRLMVKRGIHPDYYLCGGVIIGRRWILTSLGCIQNMVIGTSFARIGDHSLTTVDIGQKTVYFYRTIPGYNMALIQTRTVMTFSDYVKPACLPQDWRPYYDQKAIISGWGRVGATAGLSNILKWAEARVVPDPMCRNSTGTSTLSYYICAIGLNNSSACYGDGGGPMTIKLNGHATVVGTSWMINRGCNVRAPFMYGEVGPYLASIKNFIANY